MGMKFCETSNSLNALNLWCVSIMDAFSSQAQEIRRLSFLLGLTEQLQTVTSVKDIGHYALTYLVDNMGASFGDIKVITGEGPQRRAGMVVNEISSQFVATYGDKIVGMEDQLKQGIPYGEGLLWTVVEQGEPLFVQDYANHPKALNVFRHPGVGQLGIFPIKDIQGKIIGILTLESRNELPLQESPQQDILAAACQILGAAIERAQRQETLNRINEELETASRLKSEFLASMSHELRTPLNSIIGFADLLRRQTTQHLSDRQLSYLETIEKSGQHLLDLINDILDLSKIEAGKNELELADVDVMNLCRECLAMVQPRADAKRLNLSLEIDVHIQSALLDQRRVRQILVNLLSNAVKFTPKRGSAKLCGRLAYGHELQQENRTDQSYVDASTPYLCLEVSDTGIGIPENQQKQLFQPFFQIDGTLTRQYEGTGLGLVLTKRLAELHGGTVSFTSSENEGSTFRVWLPLNLSYQQSEATTSTKIADDDSHSQLFSPRTVSDSPAQQRILVVEDKPFNQALIAEILQLRNYQVEIIGGGQEMLDLLQQPSADLPCLPDLILMDIQLPQVDGLTLIRTLKQLPQWQDIPVIALTALAMPGDRQRCLEAGADEYISKPIQIQLLEEHLHHFLGVSS